MMTNRKQIRLKKYDYAQSGYYFVTICTQNRKNIFGEIVDGEIVGAGILPPHTSGLSIPNMVLNEIGKIIESAWQSLPKRFPIELDTFQIMPNHFHGIIIIRSDDGRDNPAPTTLGQIIAYFKYESTKQINKYYVGAGILPPHSIKKIFQRNYYEHIIRNEKELFAIRRYIKENPQ